LQFEILGKIQNEEIIARGSSIHELKRLQKAYGEGQRKKLKGTARVKFPKGRICAAEIH